MATMNKSRMEALHKLGFLRGDGNLTNAEQLSLHPSALTANKILAAIHNAENNGASADQLAKHLGISENTIFSYCRYFLDYGLIELSGERTPGQKHGMKNIYHRKSS